MATFENPAGGAPLTLDRKLFAKLDKVVLESPDLHLREKAPALCRHHRGQGTGRRDPADAEDAP